MDLSESAELQAIFHDEVVVRCAALAEGANGMVSRRLDQPEVTDRRRDAHTIKGNALVMGYPQMAEAAKLIERAFREVDEAGRPQTGALGSAIYAVVIAIPGAIETEKQGTPVDLIDAIDGLKIVLDAAPGRGAPPPPPPSPNQGNSSTRAGGPGTEPSPIKSGPPEANSDTGGYTGNEESSFDVEVSRQNLGGLTAELELALDGETTRVESARLYELINEVVELRLDAQAMAAAASAIAVEVNHALPGSTFTSKLASLESAADRFHAVLRTLEEKALVLPSVPFGEVTSTFEQLVRFLSRRLHKDVTLRVIGDNLLVDRQMVDRLREPLRHLVVNSVDHGIEPAKDRVALGKPPTGSITVEVSKVDHHIQVSVIDDGRGIDWDAVLATARQTGMVDTEVPTTATMQGFLFAPGFTTVEQNDDVSGDGSGLAMAAELVESLNGGIAITSHPDRGTTVRLTLPSSLALQGILIVEAGGHQWGIPLAAVDTTVMVVGESHDGVRYQDTDLPVVPLAHTLGLPVTADPEEVIVLTARGGLHAFSVARVVGRRQVAIKDLGPVLGGTNILGGAAVLGGGQAIGIIEPSALTAPRAPQAPTAGRPRLLVVDDSRGARQLVAAALGSAGFDVTSAGDAAEAIVALDKEDFDAVVCDFSMPGHTGVELVGLLRQRLPSLPVVMVSAVATPEDQSAAYAAGVNAYLDKSDFREGVLAATLWSLLGFVSREESAS